MTSSSRTRWAWLVGTCCGMGYLRPGPGTWTALFAAAVWFPFAVHTPQLHWQTFSICSLTLVVALGITFVGIPASSTVARESGSKDPGFVTVDELAGQLFALAILPYAMFVSNELHRRAIWSHWTRATLLYTLLGFALFRLFDIWKPFPVRQLEKLPGGVGIMVDDLAAGVLACVCLTAVVLVV